MRKFKMKFFVQFFTWILLILLLSETLVQSCSPGPRYGYRQSYYKRGSPLVSGQFVPAVSETTIGASGPSLEPITRDSPGFADLVPNYNPDVIFMDEENDGSDRMMTKRCKDRVNTLAILVEDVWPGVRLRVTEAWESEALHPRGSLHYEGRAVDLTTSDRDLTKYGMLARLAVEAGFDWVHYKSKYFIHASVRSDESDDAKYGGCFPSDSLVATKNNQSVRLEELSVGDQILAVDRVTGQLVYSDVIMMIDRKLDVSAQFLEIATTNTKLTLTKSHMLFVADHGKNSNLTMSLYNQTFPKWSEMIRPVHAEDVVVGQHVFVEPFTSDNSKPLPLPSRVTSVREVVRRGLVAPLTVHGTIVIDSTVVSCYSVFSNEKLAHASFFPARTFEFLRVANRDVTGIHWYAKTLAKLAEIFFPKSFFRFA